MKIRTVAQVPSQVCEIDM